MLPGNVPEIPSPENVVGGRLFESFPALKDASISDMHQVQNLGGRIILKLKILQCPLTSKTLERPKLCVHILFLKKGIPKIV